MMMDSTEKMKTPKEWAEVEMDSLIKKENGVYYHGLEKGEFRNEKVDMIRSALMLLITVLLLVSLMIWIIMPINTYGLLYLPDIYASGEQGANFILYSFPVIAISVLGFLYLDLGKTDVGHSSAKNSYLAKWRKPLFVKGPMGIVTRIELFFLSAFMLLLLWSFAAFVHMFFGDVTREPNFHMGANLWRARIEIAGLTLGHAGNVCLAFIFFPVTRSSSLLRLFGLTMESSVKYHIWLGHITLAFFSAHSIYFIIFWASTKQISQMLEWAPVGISNLAGEIAMVFGLVMWVTTHNRIRRKFFELFFYTHYLYILLLIFYIFHVGFSYFCITLPGIFLFLVDRYLRFLQSQRKVRLVSARILPCKAVELNFAKCLGLRYNPTSIMFINLPGISKLQWHPFTVISNNNTDPDRLSVLIKCEGSWTESLYQQLTQPIPVERLEVSVEGPYGPASIHFFKHDTLVLISGGSGITPFFSIIRELLYCASTRGCRTKQVILIASFKKSVDLTMLDLLLPVSANYDLTLLPLLVEAYVTREKEPIPDDQKLCQTLWFLPTATDVPVSASLGSNTWLWHGAILSSSFITFLLFFGILARFYIYPADGNTGTRFSYTEKTALSMFFVCFSIAVTATIAFLWHEKENARKMVEIHNLDKPKPKGMPRPGQWLYNSKRDLESFPHQSLFQNTTVHYGERPKLKKYLRAPEGSSMGVLVSGPKMMREEVAAICSSSEADNLHFESMSFNF